MVRGRKEPTAPAPFAQVSHPGRGMGFNTFEAFGARNRMGSHPENFSGWGEKWAENQNHSNCSTKPSKTGKTRV
jgi:hypothetical protein